MPVTITVTSDRGECEKCVHGAPLVPQEEMFEALRAIIRKDSEPRVRSVLCRMHFAAFNLWSQCWMSVEKERMFPEIFGDLAENPEQIRVESQEGTELVQ